jgi:hypothetical protein
MFIEFPALEMLVVMDIRYRQLSTKKISDHRSGCYPELKGIANKGIFE